MNGEVSKEECKPVAAWRRVWLIFRPLLAVLYLVAFSIGASIGGDLSWGLYDGFGVVLEKALSLAIIKNAFSILPLDWNVVLAAGLAWCLVSLLVPVRRGWATIPRGVLAGCLFGMFVGAFPWLAFHFEKIGMQALASHFSFEGAIELAAKGVIPAVVIECAVAYASNLFRFSPSQPRPSEDANLNDRE